MGIFSNGLKEAAKCDLEEQMGQPLHRVLRRRLDCILLNLKTNTFDTFDRVCVCVLVSCFCFSFV